MTSLLRSTFLLGKKFFQFVRKSCVTGQCVGGHVGCSY